MSRMITISAALIIITSGCAQPQRTFVETPKPQLFDGLGSHTRPVTTQSPEAQRFFNQGLVWTFSFNHDEAIRSFGEAARIDPTCAMAYWGVALANGPHINNPVMTPDRSHAAWSALQHALTLRDRCTPVERALIDALAYRYAENPPANRQSLDEAYATAMQGVWSAYRDDADIATLYAESMMDLQPWDLWTHEGQPKGRTQEIVAVLEGVLAKHQKHPGACHLYIHAVEGSSQPQRADAAADVLRTAVTASGHMVHMPSHIDGRVGRWSQAADQNVQAIEADRRYRELVPRQGFYAVYMAHNHHFLAFASMMEGRSETAMKAAREMIARVPPDFLREQPQFVDVFMVATEEVLKRFGRWEELLKSPTPSRTLPISRAMHSYHRGLAHAALGNVAAAQREQKRFREAVAKVPKEAMVSVNKAHTTLSIADYMLAGEIAYRRGNLDEAVQALREAVRIEDTLLYTEPPDWVQPVRHTLGAVLVHAKRFDEARQVYEEDLKHWPENGWSLLGLAQSLRGLGESAEAVAIEQRYKKAWARADIAPTHSCLCVQGEG